MIKLFKKYSFVFLVVASLLLPHSAMAQNAQCDKLRQQVANTGTNVISTLPAYCSTGDVYNKFIKLALYAVGIVATIMIIYGGYLYMTAQSNETQRAQGRTILTWAVIGLVIVLAAATIVNVVVRLLVEN
jgi:undecaprenyl pyrophosphate phosphatase UppP